LHQHDAPGCDFTAERIIREMGLSEYGRFEGDFHRQVIERAAEAIRAALPAAQPATHYGWGVAQVKEVASNRRILGADGKVRAVRYTTTRDPMLRAEPEGVIDPEVSLLSFWNAEEPIAVLSYYACHPQSYYRTGVPSPDFPGIARFIRGQALPNALHVHFNGAGGNIGAGKYNDGDKENRLLLATRLADGMKQAWETTLKRPLTAENLGWRTLPVHLPPAQHLVRDELIKAILEEPAKGYISKADQLAWLERCQEGRAIDIACLQVGDSRVLHMPGELFVEYQLAAKAMRPDLKVAMAAYGEYGPGYIGTTVAYAEGGYETSSGASSVAPEAEVVLMAAVRDLLGEADTKQSQQRVRATSPQVAAASFELIDGFEMQIVASEPNVIEPIVASYDEQGQLYVAEFLKFPAKQGKSDGPDGRIRKLQDRDGDGYYETSTVYAEGLAWPTGICPWKGGIFVVSSPDLWYLKDQDGDGRAEIKTLIVTGFGFTTEEGAANNLVWGLDHWIYGAGSNSGGSIQSAHENDQNAISLRGHDFRFHPVTGQFEAISGAEQFGNTFDDWGNRFICQNSKPAVHVVLPDHYLARNPYLPVASVLQNTWQDTEVFRASPPEAWRAARTKLRLAERPDWSGPSVEHDVFTACTGITVYRGAAYPEQFRGNLFVGDVQGNLIHRRILDVNGVAFQSRRADEGTESVRSSDNWFRPVNMVNAPDGTLHIVDMYREIIETPDSMPDEILAMVDLNSGHDRGRIYRLAPKGFLPPPPPQLTFMSTSQLVDELSNPNGWWRDTASRLIFERQDRSAVGPLQTLLRSTALAATQLHVLYALDGLGALQASDLLYAFDLPHAAVREHAIKLAEGLLGEADSTEQTKVTASAQSATPAESTGLSQLVARVLELARDENLRVRFQLALTLGELADERVPQVLASLSLQGVEDAWMRTAILSSSVNHALPMLEQLSGDANFVQSALHRDFIKQLATIVGGRQHDAEIRRLIAILDSANVADDSELMQRIVIGLADGLTRSGASLNRYLDTSSKLARSVDSMIERALLTLENSRSTDKDRQQAILVLVHGRLERVMPVLVTMLDSRRSSDVQISALRALSSFSSRGIATELFAVWKDLSPAVRGEVIEILLSREEWVEELLEAVAEQTVAPGLIPPLRKSALMEHANKQISIKARELFSESTHADRQAVIDGYLQVVNMSGNAERGRKVFETNCKTCHKFAGMGQEVGPNLATIRNRTRDGLLVQILDPNRELLANFAQYVVLMDDGRVVTGIIQSENATSITLQRAENVKETVLRKNIEKIVGSGKSLMPEGLEQSISVQQMSDLLTYLLEAGT
jgi:putative membrane-bound dehydrogenase-like protein